MADYTSFVRANLQHFKQAQAFLPFHNPTFGNPGFQDASHRVLIVRLSPFRDVDRSIPHLFLFREVRRALPRAFIDMAFFPTDVERELFAQQGIPPLLGVQSLHSAEDFDLLLISNAYTLELINLPYLLIRSSLPLFSGQRGPEWPILVLGGSNAMASQAVIRADGDSLVDGIFFGEGEGQVGKLVSILAEHRSRDADGASAHIAPGETGRARGMETAPTKAKREVLARAAAEVKGFWAAGGSAVAIKATCNAPQARHLPIDYPLLNTPEAHTAHLQIAYGCPAFCAFCFESYDRKPYRELSLPDLLHAAREIKCAQGNEELNLYSFNFNTHRDILELLPALHRLFDRVGLKSQRADVLQRTPHLLEAEVAADKRSYTLGIEGISERQRVWLHKSLTTVDIVNLLRRLLGQKIREVKLFYLLTGHESEEDLAEFRQFVRELKTLRRSRRRVRTIFSFGLLIRMPFTPLQYDRLYLDEAWRHRWRPLIGQVKSACETNGFEFRLAFDWPAYCVSQVLALGGTWLVEPIVALARAGHCLDTTLPAEYWDELRGWMVREGRWTEALLGEKGPDYPFALDFVQSNVPSDFLYRRYQEAQAGVDSGYCLGTYEGDGHCLGCGACLSPEQRAKMVRRRVAQRTTQVVTTNPVSALREVMARKRQLKPAYVRVRLDPSLAGALPAFLNATVFRGLLAAYPGLAENLLSVRESLFTVRPNDRRFPPMSGETVYALKAWDVKAVLRALCGSSEQARSTYKASSALLGAPETGAESTRPRAESARPGIESICAENERPSAELFACGFKVLGPAEGFTPGAFARIELEMHLPAAHFSEPRAHLEAYLREAYLPYTLRREEPRWGGKARYRFDVPPKGLRKKILFGGAFEVGAPGMDAQLEIGPGFDLMAFLESFGERDLYRQARVHVVGVEW